MIQDIITQAMLEYHEHVAKRMAEIPVGAILCVHDSTAQNSKLDDWKVTFVVESHILVGDEKCEKKIRKIVYGPKPEGFPNGH